MWLVPRRRALLLALGGITVAAIGVHARTARAADAGVGPAAQRQPVPPGGPALRLLALRKTYTLAGDGESLRREIAEFRRAEAAIGAAPDMQQKLRIAAERTDPDLAPRTLAVDLAFEVVNRSTAPIQILPYRSDSVILRLAVKGPEVAVVKPRRLQILEGRRGDPITLAPGKTYRVPIHDLAYGFRGDEERAYWTRPGTYSITATLATAQRPVPPGVQAAEDEDEDENEKGFAKVTLTSNTIQVKVRGTKLCP